MQLDETKIFIRCAELGISQKELLSKLNCGRDFFTRIKKGCKVNAVTLNRLAAALNCKPADLLKGE